MASMREQLGRRPAKYGFGQALGAAISGGGAYFGVLAVEKAKAEALEAARVGKLEEREYARSIDLEDRQYKADAAIAASDADKADAISIRDEQRNYESGEDATTVSKTIDVKGSDLDKVYGMAFNSDGVDPNMIYKVEVNSKGEPLSSRENSDVVIGSDGQAQKMSAGGKEGARSKPNEGEIKMFGMHDNATTAADGYAAIYGIDLNTGGDTGDGIKSSEKSVEDTFYGMLGSSSFANLLKPEDTQMVEMLQDQMLVPIRSFISGAAFTADETPVYERAYVPLPSDPPEVKAIKLLGYKSLMSSIGNADLSTPDGQRRARALGEASRMETINLIVKFKMGKIKPPATSEQGGEDAYREWEKQQEAKNNGY